MTYQAPYHEVDRKVDGAFIVKIQDGSNKQAVLDWINQEHPGRVNVTQRYEESNFYNAFAAEFSEDVLNTLRGHTDVEYICQDAIEEYPDPDPEDVPSETDLDQAPPTDAGGNSNVAWESAPPNHDGSEVKFEGVGDHKTIWPPAKSEETSEDLSGYLSITQIGSTLGLHRISHRGPAKPPTSFIFPVSSGIGAIIYVLDTGVFIEHSEFEGRASHGKSFQGSPNDVKGHGTHVAGIAIGRIYGVAKKATVVSVKVLPDEGHGATSITIAGMDWVIAQRRIHRRPTIMNMSLGGARSVASDQAVRRAVIENIAVIVSAGNDDIDASLKSPAGSPDAFTVGSIRTSKDKKAHTSNWGTSVNIWSPGTKVLSAGIRNREDIVMKSGTSMATPHMSGILALLIASIGQPDPDLFSLLRLVEQHADPSRDGLPVSLAPRA